MRTKQWLSTVGVFFVLAASSPASAGQFSLNASADTFTNSVASGNNAGGAQFLVTGMAGASTTVGPSGVLWSYLRFIMPSPTPPLAGRISVTGVSVNVTTRGRGAGANGGATAQTAGTVTLRQVLSNWSEGDEHAGATSGPGGAACVGVGATAAGPGAASCGGGSWSVSGTSLGTINVSAVATEALSFASANLNTVVAAWINGSSNFGFQMRSNTESAAGSVQRFHSINAAVGQPTMTVTYSCTGGTTEISPSFLSDVERCSACAAGSTGYSSTGCNVPAGNSCTDNNGTSAPFYTCSCTGTGYSSNGAQKCEDTDGCAGNPCNDNLNTTGACTDVAAPGTGNTCSCGSGFSSSGSNPTRCINNCTLNSAICGHGGTCTAGAVAGASATWSCAGCSTGYVSNGAAQAACVDYNDCTAGGNTSCVTSATGNSCNDAAAPSTSHTCTCGAPGYTLGPGSTSCVNFDACGGTLRGPCDDAGDTNATCTDLAPPSTTYTCTCSGASGFAFNGTTCVNACTMSSNPCGGGGSCTATGATTWTCACTTGYVSSGGSQPSCVNFNACTATGNAACLTSQGNLCNDDAPPSTSYKCDCGNGYVGDNTTSCTDPNECLPDNPCDDDGDVGSAMACSPISAPGSGYNCTCDSGFDFVGGTCTSQCNAGNNPCGIGGTCTVIGTGGWSCSCGLGYVSTSGILPTCINLNACDAEALGNCTSFSGNGCTDQAPPSLTYACNCGNAAYVNGTGSNGKPACVNKDECAPTNHCRDGGDEGASCADHPAPATGYDCTCTSPTLWTLANVGGFVQCVDTDECAGAVNPCGSGVCTNKLDGQGYSCVCDAGFTVANGNTPTPTCVNPNGCDDANAQTACVTSAPGNLCLDNPPPRVGYECDCNNAAYTLSIDRRNCVDLNACIVNHCIDEGDKGADCVDRNPPKSGYDCDCSKGWQSNGTTCVDVDECSGGGNPCGKGSCTNTKGGYQCTCPTGFELKNGTCVAGGASGYISFTAEAGSCAVGGTTQPQDALPLACLIGAALLLARRRRLAARQ